MNTKGKLTRGLGKDSASRSCPGRLGGLPERGGEAPLMSPLQPAKGEPLSPSSFSMGRCVRTHRRRRTKSVTFLYPALTSQSRRNRQGHHNVGDLMQACFYMH